MAVVYTTNMDVSMDFKLKASTAFDLYDLSGDGSKYFFTANGKYTKPPATGAPNTDFSVNYWPSSYSPYKIETIKRETAALQDSSFVYTSDVSDISFTMSVVPGNGTTRDCTKFNVRQADKSVQVHSGIGNGISYELKDFIFYNLFDTTGQWYQKATLNTTVPGVGFKHIKFVRYGATGGYLQLAKWGLYLNESDALADDNGTADSDTNLAKKVANFFIRLPAGATYVSNVSQNPATNYDPMKIISTMTPRAGADISSGYASYYDSTWYGPWGSNTSSYTFPSGYPYSSGIGTAFPLTIIMGNAVGATFTLLFTESIRAEYIRFCAGRWSQDCGLKIYISNDSSTTIKRPDATDWKEVKVTWNNDGSNNTDHNMWGTRSGTHTWLGFTQLSNVSIPQGEKGVFKISEI